MLSPSGTTLVWAERRVCFRHRSCRKVTARRGGVDKWTGNVDNHGDSRAMLRTSPVLAGMTRGWRGGSGRAVRGLAHPWPGGHRSCWGDVDGLSTTRPPRNLLDGAPFWRYPHTPHHYGRDGFSFNKKDRNVWKTLVGTQLANGSALASCVLGDPVCRCASVSLKWSALGKLSISQRVMAAARTTRGRFCRSGS